MYRGTILLKGTDEIYRRYISVKYGTITNRYNKRIILILTFTHHTSISIYRSGSAMALFDDLDLNSIGIKVESVVNVVDCTDGFITGYNNPKVPGLNGDPNSTSQIDKSAEILQVP